MDKRGKMMKKLLINLLIAGVFCLVASPALADYANPPDRESNDYFTHASWLFSETGWVDDPCKPGEGEAPALSSKLETVPFQHNKYKRAVL